MSANRMLSWVGRRWRRIIGVAFLGVACLAVLNLLFPPPLQHLQTSTVVRDRNGLWIQGFTIVDADGERRWRIRADLETIDTLFVERLIAIEDKRFWQHWGVDVLAVFRATGSLIRRGEVVSGASTITMQTARLLEPRPRTIPSKLIEMVRAVQLEMRLSKEEILELYLTLAPYGGNIEGVQAASLAWFGREPGRLTDAQQALLIALPQAPEARRPDRRPDIAWASRSVILDKLLRVQMITAQMADEAREATLPDKRLPFPRLAWHVAREQAGQADANGQVATSLDASLQDDIEMLARDHLKARKDAPNMAVLVVENRSGKVRAALGSADFDLPGGWIDMTRAERSPGSTLKPFIYGLAFDDGLASDDTLIDDAPYTFDGYRPENFTRVFHGDVSVAEALQHSLNVPAVLMLDEIGPQRFASTLVAAGIATQVPAKADDSASLAIALGGIGMTARDLAALYAGLGNGGEVAELVWTDVVDAAQPGYRMISADSADRLTQIMRQAPALAGRAPATISLNAPKVAFKTGTSYGYRDAWAAGYTDDHTVVVWMGHPSGSPRPGRTGREEALPMLFDVFDRLSTVAIEIPQASASPTEDNFETGAALGRLAPGKADQPPEIVFPEDGVTVYQSDSAKARGFSLTARGGAGGYQWYVDGEKVVASGEGNRPIWYPATAGFYSVTVVDALGQRTLSSVRVENAE